MTKLGLMATVLACSAMAASSAMAQSRSRGRDAPRSPQGSDLPASVPPAVSTLAPVQGIAGPHLEPGAVICGSEQDLQRRGEVSRRISDGAADAGDPMIGCRLLNQPRGVEIVARHGLGRTQIKVKPSGEMGWTDAYFPS